jgi:hypothetical protein
VVYPVLEFIEKKQTFVKIEEVTWAFSQKL